MSDDEFTEAVRKYSDTVFKVCYSCCKNRSDAEDMMQNVFLKLYRYEEKFKDSEHVRLWLIRVSINECNDYFSSSWRRRVTCSINDERFEDEGLSFEIPEQSELFYAVRALPPKYRVVVHLYYYEDYSVSEIADMLGLKETAVQTQLMRARNKLKIKLSEANYEF
ncbi:MAG: RNA polymerase sigma factor [Acutalibacteraceae bacterium]